jgi:NifU-like protein involved in Fe-S cluster formation
MNSPAADAGGGAVLYTREMLALAVSLAATPFDPAMPCIGEARSRTCGSSLRLSCSLDGEDRIEALGLQVAACAVGQAAAAIFSQRAIGMSRGEIDRGRESLARWLAGGGPLPDWRGIAALAAARAYPARHGAILLAWDAALAALSNAESRG